MMILTFAEAAVMQTVKAYLEWSDDAGGAVTTEQMMEFRDKKGWLKLSDAEFEEAINSLNKKNLIEVIEW